MRGDFLAPLKAGALYFAVVFASGFVLGTARTLFLAPQIGELTAVALELPVILVIAWTACGWILRRVAISAAVAARTLMGAFAFALLMTGEIFLALAFGGTLGGFLTSLGEPAGALGLAGQVLFALFPLIRRSPASI